jgi:hypothetical protein
MHVAHVALQTHKIMNEGAIGARMLLNAAHQLTKDERTE